MSGRKILGLLESIHSDLPRAERKVATIILKTPEEVVHATATALGEKAGTSAATVIRLCKRLQVKSFTELKILLSSELTAQTSANEYSDLAPDESAQSIIQKMVNNSYIAMEDTMTSLSTDALEEAVAQIEHTEIIYVFGVGASSLVAENIAHKWSRIGKTCIFISDPHVLIAAMTAGDAKKTFIGISNSGETKEVIALAKIANEKDMATIGISRFGNNSLAKQVDVNLQHARTNEARIRSAATSSLHAQFVVVDSLFYLYASKNFNESLASVQASREEVQAYNCKD